ncbi:MAG TPA: metal-dependent hydrolase [Patescibacteria group bacterium]|nr:metal-dependent hydrolase [Patescibacteria group bacterium]
MVDPVTHALLGAAMAQTLFPASEGRRPLLLGAVGGMLADADIFLRPLSDPALPWEAHRHITHALAFSPVGGLVTALPFLMWPWWRGRWKKTLGAATLAYAGHGPLDACTSYGTHLLLPFSTSSTSWDIIAIIDPLFTAILLAGIAATVWRARVAPALLALLICAGYLALGARQHAVALDAVAKTAASRGHTVLRARAMPTPGNLVVWRGLYVADGRIHADGVRVPLLGSSRVRQGVSVAIYRPGTLAQSAEEDPREVRVADVVARFDQFADGFMARDPRQPDVLGDMRYSLEVASFSPLWGIRLNAGTTGDPVSWVDLVTDRRASLATMWNDLRRE